MRSKVSLPNVIDGVTGSDSIVNMWRSHYNDLFNCIKKDNNVHDLYNNVCYEPDIEVSHADITSGIEGLANNKSCGLDGVSAEHLKHSSNRIAPMLAMCFTGFFIHGICCHRRLYLWYLFLSSMTNEPVSVVHQITGLLF